MHNCSNLSENVARTGLGTSPFLSKFFLLRQVVHGFKFCFVKQKSSGVVRIWVCKDLMFWIRWIREFDEPLSTMALVALFRRQPAVAAAAPNLLRSGSSQLPRFPQGSPQLSSSRSFSFASKKRDPKTYHGPVLSYRTKNPPEFYKRIPFPADKRFLVRVYDRVFRESPFIIVYQHRSTQENVDKSRHAMAPYMRLMKVKVSLARMAVWGTPLQDITGLFAGPTDLAFVEKEGVDVIRAARAFIATQKDQPSFILGGVLNGRPVSRDMILRIAEMPNDEFARAELITVLNQPARSLVQVLSNPTTNLVKVLEFASKSEGEGAEPAPEES